MKEDKVNGASRKEREKITGVMSVMSSKSDRKNIGGEMNVWTQDSG